MIKAFYFFIALILLNSAVRAQFDDRFTTLKKNGLL